MTFQLLNLIVSTVTLAVALKAGFWMGRVDEKLKDHDRRITAQENHGHFEVGSQHAGR